MPQGPACMYACKLGRAVSAAALMHNMLTSIGIFYAIHFYTSMKYPNTTPVGPAVHLCSEVIDVEVDSICASHAACCPSCSCRSSYWCCPAILEIASQLLSIWDV